MAGIVTTDPRLESGRSSTFSPAPPGISFQARLARDPMDNHDPMSSDGMETHQKALRINLDTVPYGTFAEVGAGQEVARWFFRVGGASGTIAKTMSAYDMTVSDAIYGPSDRYVSRSRLRQMLEYEYELLLERLASKRGTQTRFFVFADTVTARSYTRQDDAHGWMGVRFQAEPGLPPSQILLHLRMTDRENLQQQEALGIVGVNLLHGALYLSHDPRSMLDSLMDNLSRDRIEIDLVKFDGPAFAHRQSPDGSAPGPEGTRGCHHDHGTTARWCKPQRSCIASRSSSFAAAFRPTTHATLDLHRTVPTQVRATNSLIPEDQIGSLPK
jgi:hypothetical protein